METTQTLCPLIGAKDPNIPLLKRLGFKGVSKIPGVKNPFNPAYSKDRLDIDRPVSGYSRECSPTNVGGETTDFTSTDSSTTDSGEYRGNEFSAHSNRNSDVQQQEQRQQQRHSTDSGESHSGSSADQSLSQIPEGSSSIGSYSRSIPNGTSSHDLSHQDSHPPDVSADRLASFLSRIKYLYDERDTSETVQLSMPGNSSFADQRSLIKSQAERVRNQLDLKFSSISFITQLDKFADCSLYETGYDRYNPLQIMRDRKKRPKVSKQPSRVNIWHIPVSEQIQDARWRFRTSRIRAHKQKKKQRKSSSGKEVGLFDRADFSSESPERVNNSGDVMMTPPRPLYQSEDSRSHSVSPLGASYTFLTPEAVSHNGRNMEAPTSSLPKSECTELINRLRSSHSEPGQEVPPKNSTQHRYSTSTDSLNYPNKHHGYGNVTNPNSGPNSRLTSRTGSSDGSFNGMPIIDGPMGSFSSEHEGEVADYDNPVWARSRFCRNTASVADTWNRLYRWRASSTGTQPDDGHLKALTQVNTRGSTASHSALSTISSAVIDDEEEDTLQANNERALSSPVVGTSLENAPKLKSRHSQGSAVSDNTPLLTITSDSGREKVLGSQLQSPAQNSTNSLALSPLQNSTQNLMQPLSGPKARPASISRGESYIEDTVREKVARSDELSEPTQGFGSLRQSIADIRKDPYERTLNRLSCDLKFLIPYYSIILRRENARSIHERCKSKASPYTGCNFVQMSDALKTDMVAEFMRYLSQVEHSIVNDQQLLDAEIASNLDGLRVTTDLMVSEVNSTLNRRIREVSSRMERLTMSREGSCLTSVFYILIEYVVLFAMWLIWCGVQIFKPLKWLILVIRFACNQLIVA